MDVALKKRHVERAYELYAPVYDFIFDWIFAPGRSAAIRHLAVKPGESVLEVGIGTGLNLPLYPPDCRLTGIDLSSEMLDKAVGRVETLAMPNVRLKVMDATSMDFGESEFDKAIATYTISAVPDPFAVLREMRRVVKPAGLIVLLNHFRSERRVVGLAEDLVAPVCTRLGWRSNLSMKPLLAAVGLQPELIARVNMFNGWRLVKCVNRKYSPSPDPTPTAPPDSPAAGRPTSRAWRGSCCGAPRASGPRGSRSSPPARGRGARIDARTGRRRPAAAARRPRPRARPSRAWSRPAGRRRAG